MKKVLDIRKIYNKKKLPVNKDALSKAIYREDVTIFLEEEIHYNNGETEFIYRMCIKNNFI